MCADASANQESADCAVASRAVDPPTHALARTPRDDADVARERLGRVRATHAATLAFAFAFAFADWNSDRRDRARDW